jgi:hypothetical protein
MIKVKIAINVPETQRRSELFLFYLTQPNILPGHQ